MTTENQLKQVLENEKLSVGYRLYAFQCFLEKELPQQKKFYRYLLLASEVLEKYQYSSDVLLKQYMSLREIIKFGAEISTLDKEKQIQMIQDLMESTQIERLVSECSFFVLKLRGFDGDYLIPAREFQGIQQNAAGDIILNCEEGIIPLVEFKKIINLEPIQYLELIKKETLIHLGEFKAYDGPEAELIGSNHIIKSIETNKKTQENIAYLKETQMINAESVSQVFKAFDRSKTESEIKNILSQINDEKILSEILQRVSVDYEKIMSVFKEVGEDGLDIDIIIACLYVELKAKWIQLNIQSQYQAMNGRPTDMVSMGHGSVISHFLTKIEPFLAGDYMKTVDKLLSEPVAAA